MAKIEPARLGEIRRAVSEFLDLARDSHTTGQPPRQSDPAVKALIDTVFDTSDLDGATLAATDIGRALDWFATGDRIGVVYILAGTGVAEIAKLSERSQDRSSAPTATSPSSRPSSRATSTSRSSSPARWRMRRSSGWRARADEAERPRGEEGFRRGPFDAERCDDRRPDQPRLRRAERRMAARPPRRADGGGAQGGQVPRPRAGARDARARAQRGRLRAATASSRTR